MINRQMQKKQKEAFDRAARKDAELDAIFAWGGEYGSPEFFSGLSAKEVKFLEEKIHKLVRCESDGYEDNWRWARVENLHEMSRYAHWKSKGCCGFADQEFTDKNGVKFMVGFNHGH